MLQISGRSHVRFHSARYHGYATNEEHQRTNEIGTLYGRIYVRTSCLPVLHYTRETAHKASHR